MFVILPFASICYSLINWKGHFTSDNVMLPWNVTYALMNFLLIITYFGIATDFIYQVRSNLLARDNDPWEKHVEEIVLYVNYGEKKEIKDDFDKETWTGKLLYWILGEPQP